MQTQNQLFLQEVRVVHVRRWVDLQQELHPRNIQHINLIQDQERRLEQFLLAVNLRVVIRRQLLHSCCQWKREENLINRFPPEVVEKLEVRRFPQHLIALEQVDNPLPILHRYFPDLLEQGMLQERIIERIRAFEEIRPGH